MVLSKEEIAKLTPEALAEYTAALTDHHQTVNDINRKLSDKLDDLEDENEQLSTKLDSANTELKKDELPTFEMEVSKGKKDTYQFTAPTLTWDDGSVQDVRHLASSEDEEDEKIYTDICRALVARKSGLVVKIKA
ncbi:MAG: hypothetical protein WDO15_11380 [Bacteroidota bacterium]